MASKDPLHPLVSPPPPNMYGQHALFLPLLLVSGLSHHSKVAVPLADNGAGLSSSGGLGSRGKEMGFQEGSSACVFGDL